MANKTTTKADLEAEIALLKAQLAAKEAATPVATAVQTPVTPVYITAPSTDVTLVYMSDSLGYMKVGTLELRATRFGEQFTISRNQFDALVGQYRRWFDSGILAVSPKDIEVASMKGLRTSDEYALSAEVLGRLGTMSPTQIEELWNSATAPEHKRSIIMFFKRKYIEGVEPGYRDRARIDALDRLSDGAFKQERDEISGRVKLQQTDM